MSNVLIKPYSGFLTCFCFQVKLWYIPDDGMMKSINEWLCELAGHSRRVAYLEWHPTAENILASAGHDCRVSYF